MMRSIVRAFVWMTVLQIVTSAALADQPAAVRVATFRCDVTPPLEGKFYGGWDQPLTKLEDPLWAKGIVLDDGRGRYVICAMDWCVLCNSTHTLFRRKLAAAAGTDISRVAVQSVHQHTAPIANGDEERLVRQATGAPGRTNLEALETISDRLAAAVKQSLGHGAAGRPPGLGQPRSRRWRHTPRVWQDGKIRYAGVPARIRSPRCPTATSIMLVRDARPRRQAAGPAAPTRRIPRRAAATAGGNGLRGLRPGKTGTKEHVLQIYFTGCSGDVTMGKYNDGSLEAGGAYEASLAGMEAAVGHAAWPRRSALAVDGRLPCSDGNYARPRPDHAGRCQGRGSRENAPRAGLPRAETSRSS